MGTPPFLMEQPAKHRRVCLYDVKIIIKESACGLFFVYIIDLPLGRSRPTRKRLRRGKILEIAAASQCQAHALLGNE